MTKQTQLVTADYRAAFGWTEEQVEYRWMTGEFVHRETGVVLEKVSADLEFACRAKLNKIKNAEKRAEMNKAKTIAVQDAKAVLDLEFKTDGVVSIKKTQPSVEYKGIKFYTIIDPLGRSNRLNFVTGFTVEQVQKMVHKYKIVAQEGALNNRSCWVNHMTVDELGTAIRTIGDLLGE